MPNLQHSPVTHTRSHGPPPPTEAIEIVEANARARASQNRSNSQIRQNEAARMADEQQQNQLQIREEDNENRVLNLSTEPARNLENENAALIRQNAELAEMMRSMTEQLERMQQAMGETREFVENNRSIREPSGEQAENKMDSRVCDDVTQRRTTPLDLIPLQVRLPRGGWIKNPFDELKYHGKSDKQNPMRFLQKFEKLALYENVPEEEQLHYFGRCMRGAASQWYELQMAEDIAEIKRLFTQTYWGTQAQTNFRQRVYFGRYRANEDNMTMAEYALGVARQAKTLLPPMTDDEIVQTVRQHFDVDVARELRPSVVKTVNDMIEMLDTIENERETRRLRGQAQRAANTSGHDKSCGRKTNAKVADNVKSAANNRGYASNNNDRRNDGRYENSTRRDTATQRQSQSRQSSYNKSQAWRKADSPEARRKNAVDIDELPDSGDDNAKPKVTRYTRESETNKSSRAYAKTATKNAYDRGRKMAAITAVSHQDHPVKLEDEDERSEDVESSYDDDHDEPSSADEKTCCAITREARRTDVIETTPSNTNDDNNNNDETSKVKNNEINDASPVNIIRTREIVRELDQDMAREQAKSIDQTDVPMIDMKFGECTTKALVDTGAQVTAMTRSFYQQLCKYNYKMELLPIKKFTLRGAFSERGSTITSKVRVKFEYRNANYTHEFFIVDNLAYEIVLGIDFLVKYRLILACDNEIDVKFRKSINTIMRINALTRDQATKELQKILNKFTELFNGEIGRVNHYQHRIEMNVTTRPYKKKSYPIPEIHMNRVRKYIKELERKGIVRKQATQFVNPLVVVIKKNGDIRLCLDAREINKQMANDHAQPPTIEEIFRRIGKRKYFSTLDVSHAFWQIPLTSDSMKYAGFMFDGQTYVFQRMPFGLKTSGASFTRAMHETVGDQDFLLVYLDDVLVASNSLEEHLIHLEWVLAKLEQAGFRLNREKCEFLREEIKFLGHTFSEIKAEINQETRQAIANFERPRNKKHIQSFLGLVNWDRRFIKNLARLTKPLEELLRKGEKFDWNATRQSAFNEIKQAFREAPDLYLCRPDAKFGIYVDAARTGLGARLYQYQPDTEPEVRQTVGYASRSLKGAEINYTITELECLALVWALRKWHTLLMGRHVRVHTDHQALKFLSTCVQNNSRIARWFAFLQEFELEIIHLPGRDNEIADALSRRATNTDDHADNEIKRIALIRDVNQGNDTHSWINVIRQAQDADETLREAMQNHPETIYERNGLIRIRRENSGEKIALPRTITWRMTREIHQLLVHFGTDKICDFLKRYFDGANFERFARDVVASCEVCQATKYYTRPTVGIEYYELPEAPGQTLSMDIFGPLPATHHGLKYILVIMDQFSKFVKFYPMKDQRLDTIVEILENRFFHDVGIPQAILTDNGGQFLADRWREFAVRKGFTVRRTSPYNPQSNPVERVMRELGRVLRAYSSQRRHAWHRIIKRAEEVINHTRHASHGFTPVELNNGENNVHLSAIHPALIPQDQDPANEADDGRQPPRQQLTWADKTERARQRLAEAARIRKKQADKHGTAIYHEGQRVWVKIHRKPHARKKLVGKFQLIYEGPYRIQRISRPNAYLVEDLNGQVIGAFNARHIKPHRAAQLRGDDDDQTEEPDDQPGNGGNDGESYAEDDEESYADNDGESYTEKDGESFDGRYTDNEDDNDEDQRLESEADHSYDESRSDPEDGRASMGGDDGEDGCDGTYGGKSAYEESDGPNSDSDDESVYNSHGEDSYAPSYVESDASEHTSARESNRTASSETTNDTPIDDVIAVPESDESSVVRLNAMWVDPEDSDASTVDYEDFCEGIRRHNSWEKGSKILIKTTRKNGILTPVSEQTDDETHEEGGNDVQMVHEDEAEVMQQQQKSHDDLQQREEKLVLKVSIEQKVTIERVKSNETASSSARNHSRVTRSRDKIMRKVSKTIDLRMCKTTKECVKVRTNPRKRNKNGRYVKQIDIRHIEVTKVTRHKGASRMRMGLKTSSSKILSEAAQVRGANQGRARQSNALRFKRSYARQRETTKSLKLTKVIESRVKMATNRERRRAVIQKLQINADAHELQQRAERLLSAAEDYARMLPDNPYVMADDSVREQSEDNAQICREIKRLQQLRGYQQTCCQHVDVTREETSDVVAKAVVNVSTQYVRDHDQPPYEIKIVIRGDECTIDARVIDTEVVHTVPPKPDANNNAQTDKNVRTIESILASVPNTGETTLAKVCAEAALESIFQQPASMMGEQNEMISSGSDGDEDHDGDDDEDEVKTTAHGGKDQNQGPNNGSGSSRSSSGSSSSGSGSSSSSGSSGNNNNKHSRKNARGGSEQAESSPKRPREATTTSSIMEVRITTESETTTVSGSSPTRKRDAARKSRRRTQEMLEVERQQQLEKRRNEWHLRKQRQSTPMAITSEESKTASSLDTSLTGRLKPMASIDGTVGMEAPPTRSGPAIVANQLLEQPLVQPSGVATTTLQPSNATTPQCSVVIMREAEAKSGSGHI